MNLFRNGNFCKFFFLKINYYKNNKVPVEVLYLCINFGHYVCLAAGGVDSRD